MMEEEHGLINFLYTETTISCGGCGKKNQFFNIPNELAVKLFSQGGWRCTVYGNVYCKKCSEKKLKPKK